ncbi:RDD family protein [Neobacillus cucumis]|uniref:RDD family protein n=1 Tax=Neobacillus cucumis TaxID=1740721 RepID=UPI001962F894|nr:RDD family protein [Neobacillus cucumis]MBM7655605.1 putative RDD family membrane protein YckC [Neobacillus cucumis]
MTQDQIDIKTPEYVAIQFRMAGLGSRAAAYMIDRVLLLLVNIIIIVVLFFVYDGMDSLPFFLRDSSVPIAIAVIGLFIINWGYFFFFEFFSGGKTLGKRMVGIRVIQDNGHSITLLSSFIRNLVRMIDSLPTAYFLGIILIFFHPKHKRLGDLVAGTIVVHERKAKKKNKPSHIEKEINLRGLNKNDLHLDEWTVGSFKEKDWKLVSTYANRFLQIPQEDRNELTKQIADLLLPKLGFEVIGKSEIELENILLGLYFILKDEWEFEL